MTHKELSPQETLNKITKIIDEAEKYIDDIGEKMCMTSEKEHAEYCAIYCSLIHDILLIIKDKDIRNELNLFNIRLLLNYQKPYQMLEPYQVIEELKNIIGVKNEL